MSFFADSRRTLSFEERNRPFQTAIMTSLKHREITGNYRRRLRLLLPPLKLLDMPLRYNFTIAVKQSAQFGITERDFELVV